MSVQVASQELQNEVVQAIRDVHYIVPDHMTKIFKDECMYCFHTPYFEGGLFVCLKSFCSFCSRHLEEYAQKTNSVAFVKVSSKKVPIARDEEPEQKISKLAVGIEGGFCNEKFDILDEYYLVVYPRLDVLLTITPALGEHLFTACNKVITTTSAERLEMLQNASNAWDGEVKQITKHANLDQLNNNVKVPSNGWACQEEECGLNENLWLNLVDGAIRCGRSQFIAEGQMSKGNNHMKQYFDATGFALVVKLGTIEKDGSADVYSYDEDDAVIDPNLRKHLAHFGLDIDKLEKTEKSTLELELGINQKWEWSKIQEDGTNLENIYGPGYTGLINIGSSCYMNSVLQSILQIPDFRLHFGGEGAISILSQLPVHDIYKDFNAQLAKLVQGMLSGDYAVEDSPNNGIKPTQFKRVTGAGHIEFSTAKQQDAEEYIRYLIEKISSKNSPSEDPTTALRFKTEVRFEDLASRMVRYSDGEEVVLSLPVPKDCLKPIPDQEGRFSINFSDCVSAAFAPEIIDGFKSSVTGETKGATHIRKMRTFPDFLFVHMQKFTIDDTTYTAKKLDVDIQVDDILDLSAFRGSGLQVGETLLMEDVKIEQNKAPEANREYVGQLEAMGFSHNASVKAVLETKNSGVEAAAEWIMVRLDDPALNDPPATTSSDGNPADDSNVEMLQGFGFTAHQARFALSSNNNDPNAAAEWLFVHAEEVPPEQKKLKQTKKEKPQLRDGNGIYRLVGFISHMGSSPHSGHYVTHLLKEGKWVLYNDEKVAISQNPPKQLAYVYLFQRL